MLGTDKGECEMKDIAMTIFVDDGAIRTEVNLEFIPDTLRAGIMLASATRVIAAAMRHNGKKKEWIEEQLQAAIAETYHKDLQFGSMGESKSLYVV